MYGTVTPTPVDPTTATPDVQVFYSHIQSKLLELMLFRIKFGLDTYSEHIQADDEGRYANLHIHSATWS